MRTYGADYRGEHVLADGGRVAIRPIAPSDADELRRAFRQLSPEGRFQRFLRAIPELTDDMVAYLTRVDGESHVAFVAFLVAPDLIGERGVGVARFVRLADEPTLAEAAVTVLDDAQGRGIAHLLLGTLVEAARERGVRAFKVDVLASNEAVRRLLAEAHAELWADDGQVMTFRVPLDRLRAGDGAPKKSGFFGSVVRAGIEAFEHVLPRGAATPP